MTATQPIVPERADVMASAARLGNPARWRIEAIPEFLARPWRACRRGLACLFAGALAILDARVVAVRARKLGAGAAAPQR